MKICFTDSGNKYLDSQEEVYSCTDFSSLNSLLDKGVGTPKYWFHRLDYYLWKEWHNQEKPAIDGMNARELGEKIEKFQFRHNRSVEHIFPQSLGRDNEDWKEKVDCFGNLALISISSNSSYSDQEVREKKTDFVHRTKKYGIESLKQLAIYSNLDSWISNQGEKHRMEMLELLKNSFSRKKQAI
jgi:hypothetical protein